MENKHRVKLETLVIDSGVKPILAVPQAPMDQRFQWTPQLHEKFIQAVASLGIEKATPMSILHLMNVKGLTLNIVASHLNIYRNRCEKAKDESLSVSESEAVVNPWEEEDSFGDGYVKPSPQAIPFDKALRFCSLLPHGYEFERDTLIQLCMGIGFFEDEQTAALFLVYCFSKGYVQPSRVNLFNGKALYKFQLDTQSHHLVGLNETHFLRINEGCSKLNTHLTPQQVSHVSVMCDNHIDSTFLNGFTRFRQLRTLLFLNAHKSTFNQIPRHLFPSLQMLQVLDLSHTHLSDLPNSVATAKSLRYLDISHTPIKRLPETIDYLTNLQTLKLRGCSNFFSLPKGTKKLVNLRHLDLDILHQLRSMPPGMGALTNLRTLSAFLVGVEDDCSIRQLRSLNFLSGSCCLSGLENVSSHEALEAFLCHKSQLKKLEFRWNEYESHNVEHRVGDRMVLSLLRPNVNLEELKILCYGGFELPCWITDPSFSKLVSITLFNCENCLVLPSLGQLPSLKVLNIVEFHELKLIDQSFNGVRNQGESAFRMLENLTIENMNSLEEWKGIGDSDFPRLCKLIIKHCPKLHSLCTLSSLCSLEYLEISHCLMLKSCFVERLPLSLQTFITEACPEISAILLRNKSDDWSMVKHVPNIWVDHQEILFSQRSL